MDEIEPKFGEWLRGTYASESNPHRDGMYVRTIHRKGRMNPGKFYELTDGNGAFWMYPAQSVERIAAALRSAQVPEWRPIETAPKDGTSILAWRFYSVAIRWRPDLDGEFPWDAVSLESHPSTNFTTNGFMEDDRALTHWMPLPSPPEDLK